MIERLLGLLRDRRSRRVRVRPTWAGGGYIALLIGVLLAAANTGNNLLYVVLAGQLAVLVLSNLLAEVNLRGLELDRRLPPEVFAGQAALGSFELYNRRRRGPAVTVHLEELSEGRARGLATVVEAGEEASVPVRWHFSNRGLVALDRVRLWSDFPFGLVRRSMVFSMPAEVLVYPQPVEGRSGVPALVGGATREDPRRRGREGDFQSLRPYQPGDPLRDLHWPTTARTRRPMVVERSAAGAPEVVIRVEDAEGERWERALSRAAGEVERHARRGDAVGMVLDGQLLEPRTGDAWRRRLLTRLALAEPRGGG